MKQSKSVRDRALFRFMVVSKVYALTSRGISLSLAIKQTIESDHSEPIMDSRSLSERSLYRWVKSYKERHFDGLYDSPQTKIAYSNILADDFQVFLQRQKADKPEISVPEIIRRAEKKGILRANETSRTSVWRACNRLNLPMTRVKSLSQSDMRRFSYQHRMQMVLCDGTHFRVGVSRTKRVAIIFLDDSTRYVLHAVVGPSESKELFLRGFFETICRHGKMDALFTDNGSGFKSHDTQIISARLDIKSIYGRAGYPEGHGKIERFNQTIKKDLISDWDRQPGVDDNCSSLELKIQTYLKEDYGKRDHEGLEGIPSEHFFSDSRPLNFEMSVSTLKHHFMVRAQRKVSKDNIIKFDGCAYEMPLGYAGTKQEIRRNILENTILFLHDGSLMELHLVDLLKNARDHRGKRVSKSGKSETTSFIEKSSASQTFDNSFKPIINPDGGYNEKE